MISYMVTGTTIEINTTAFPSDCFGFAAVCSSCSKCIDNVLPGPSGVASSGINSYPGSQHPCCGGPGPNNFATSESRYWSADVTRAIAEFHISFQLVRISAVGC